MRWKSRLRKFWNTFAVATFVSPHVAFFPPNNSKVSYSTININLTLKCPSIAKYFSQLLKSQHCSSKMHLFNSLVLLSSLIVAKVYGQECVLRNKCECGKNLANLLRLLSNLFLCFYCVESSATRLSQNSFRLTHSSYHFSVCWRKRLQSRIGRVRWFLSGRYNRPELNVLLSSLWRYAKSSEWSSWWRSRQLQGRIFALCVQPHNHRQQSDQCAQCAGQANEHGI